MPLPSRVALRNVDVLFPFVVRIPEGVNSPILGSITP